MASSLRTVAQRGLAAGAAGVAAAAAGASAGTDCRSAPSDDFVTPHALPLQAAADAIKQEIGLISLGTAPDGQEWLDLDDALDLAASIAAEPDVQRVILEKSKRAAAPLKMRLEGHEPAAKAAALAASAASASAASLTSSYEEIDEGDDDAEGGVGASPPATTKKAMADHAKAAEEGKDDDDDASLASSYSLPTPSLSDLLVAENEALRNEVQALRRVLFLRLEADPPTAKIVRPGVSRLQAAARGHLARRGFYTAAASAARTAVVVVTMMVEPSDATGNEIAAAPRVRVRLAARRPLIGSPAAKRSPSAARQGTAPASSLEGGRDALVISVSVLVGLLALAMLRNPAGVRTAAVSAASVVTALYVRAQQRATRPAA